MKEIALKGASGLGDSVYGVAIAEYYSRYYDVVHIMSDYPVLFSHLPKVKCYKHEKLNYIKTETRSIPIDHRFTYCGRKYTPGSSQFEDSYLSIGVSEKLGMHIPWKIRNNNLIDDIIKKSNGKKICILSAPYEPFGREDHWGVALRIKPDIMQEIVNKREDILFVQVGTKFVLHVIKNTLNLIGKTSVSDLMDLVVFCDYGLSQIGNLLPLCESQKKKNVLIFSHPARTCGNRFIEAITPEKCVHYKDLNLSFYDDEDTSNVLKELNDFLK